MGLFYPNGSKPQLVGYANVGYHSDPHKGRSQTGYLFTYENIAISWRFVKQTISSTFSNHVSIFYIIFVGLLIWDYFIQMDQNHS